MTFALFLSIILFGDFGLAKEIRVSERVDEEIPLYKMSGETGSMRYMSPEIHLSKPYNLTADVHSFAMLLLS